MYITVFFRQLTVVKIDASFFLYMFGFDETFKFTAREDEVSFGVYWFFRRHGMEWNLAYHWQRQQQWNSMSHMHSKS